jgi:hypothetical protein
MIISVVVYNKNIFMVCFKVQQLLRWIGNNETSHFYFICHLSFVSFVSNESNVNVSFVLNRNGRDEKGYKPSGHMFNLFKKQADKKSDFEIEDNDDEEEEGNIFKTLSSEF